MVGDEHLFHDLYSHRNVECPGFATGASNADSLTFFATLLGCRETLQRVVTCLEMKAAVKFSCADLYPAGRIRQPVNYIAAGSFPYVAV